MFSQQGGIARGPCVQNHFLQSMERFWGRTRGDSSQSGAGGVISVQHGAASAAPCGWGCDALTVTRASRCRDATQTRLPPATAQFCERRRRLVGYLVDGDRGSGSPHCGLPLLEIGTRGFTKASRRGFRRTLVYFTLHQWSGVCASTDSAPFININMRLMDHIFLAI